MSMKNVNVAELKQKLSAYLHVVEQGEEVVITSHRRPVARLSPEPTAGWLVRESKVPAAAIRKLKGLKRDPKASAEQYLYEDRSRR